MSSPVLPHSFLVDEAINPIHVDENFEALEAALRTLDDGNFIGTTIPRAKLKEQYGLCVIGTPLVDRPIAAAAAGNPAYGLPDNSSTDFYLGRVPDVAVAADWRLIGMSINFGSRINFVAGSITMQYREDGVTVATLSEAAGDSDFLRSAYSVDASTVNGRMELRVIVGAGAGDLSGSHAMLHFRQRLDTP